jgi:hypothetical protein
MDAVSDITRRRLVIDIKPRHCEVTLWLLRFFLETDRLPISVEFDYAVPFRVAHLISKNAGATLMDKASR